MLSPWFLPKIILRLYVDPDPFIKFLTTFSIDLAVFFEHTVVAAT